MSHHHHCSDGSCSSHSHGGGSCSDESCNCCCHRSCNCSCHHGSGKYSDQLLKLADEAWMEVVKEKIKDNIKKTSSEHLDQLAQLVSKTNKQRWIGIMAQAQNSEDFERSLRDLMHHQK